MSPNGDPRVDITDHYTFQKPGDDDKTILILNVNPLAPTLATTFEPGAVYEIKVDSAGDAIADINSRVTFSQPVNGHQKARVRRVVGSGEGETIIEGAPVNFDRSITITRNGPY
jgi:hypothetical protein